MPRCQTNEYYPSHQRFRADLRLLDHLAAITGARHKAVMGIGDGQMIAAVASGAARAHRRASRTARGAVRVYHWHSRLGRLLHLLDTARARLGISMRDIVLKRMARGTRAAWEEDVVLMVRANDPPFGLIAHTGNGMKEDILGDLEVLVPMMRDDTLVAIGSQEQPGARGAFTTLQQDGWDGVALGHPTLGVLQRRAGKKE